MTPERRRVHGIHVTEHAIVRYLERHYGIDVQQLLDELVSARNAELIRQLPNCRVGIHGDLWLNVKDGVIVTVEPSDLRHKPAGKRQGNARRKEEERSRRRANGDASPDPPQ